MNRKKHPILELVEPHYPEKQITRFKRREFLQVLGMGTASITVLKACGSKQAESSSENELANSTGTPAQDMDTETVQDGTSGSGRMDDDPTSDESVRDNSRQTLFLSQSIPQNGTRKIELLDGGHFTYYLNIIHDTPSFSEIAVANSDQILTETDHIVKQLFAQETLTKDEVILKAQEEILRVVETIAKNRGAGIQNEEVTIVAIHLKARGDRRKDHGPIRTLGKPSRPFYDMSD